MTNDLLVIGIGNNVRQDDGLGWQFLESICSLVHVEYRYQLQIEDADLVSRYQTIVFVDATSDQTEKGFSFTLCSPDAMENSFSTHRVAPSALIWLSQELYGMYPKSYVLAIQGYTWELHEELSAQAKQNLSNALTFFNQWLKTIALNSDSKISGAPLKTPLNLLHFGDG